MGMEWNRRVAEASTNKFLKERGRKKEGCETK